jgi:predicted acetyltransferase
VPLRLRPLKIDDEADAHAAHAELAADGFVFLWGWEPQIPWASYLEALGDLRRGIAIPAGSVPASLLVADVDDVLVGRVSVRHELNDLLAATGGHIGFGVRPQYRGRGFATEMLRQALVIARAEGVDRVLVTCDEDNVASASVIERAGGSLEDVRLDPKGVRKRRYWID